MIVVRYGETGTEPDSIFKGHNVYCVECSGDECPWNELDSKLVCKELDDEVANLVKKSPQWRPAVKDGVPVTARVLLPVIFQTRIKS